MNKKLVLALGAAALLLMLPLSNLRRHPSHTALTREPHSDLETAKAASLLEAKCAWCHVPGTPPPFYAKLPVASALIGRDIRAGLDALDIKQELFPAGAPPSEVALAKLEYALARGSMPPTRFLALHWNGGVDAEMRADLLTWIGNVRTREYAPKGVSAQVAAGPVQPLPAALKVDARKAALGKKLYFDKRLSGDDTVSCATCHDLGKGGTDQAKVSTGIKGQKGGINAPTTFNAALQFLQFWDGRAPTLQAQASGPPQNPIEMGSNWKEIPAKLAKDAAFAAEFRAVYPSGLNEKNITDAIAEFEKTLLTPGSKFDKFLLGTGGLAADETRGWELFQRKGCVTCHAGELLGGRSFELMGRKADYFAGRSARTDRRSMTKDELARFASSGGLTDADNGRWGVTKNEADRHRFKVPTLRNVARTAPYFHDGSTADLKEAVRVMSRYQLGATLTDDERDAIVKFLETLTGEFQGKPL